MPDATDAKDFGKEKINLSEIDAYFLDTNMIIAFLYQNDDRHLSCYNFISYLIVNDIKMYISEMTVAEVINSFARILYIDDELENYKVDHGGSLPKPKKELRQLKKYFKSNWAGHVIKDDLPKLSQYNKRAIDKFSPFMEICYLISASDNSISNGLRLSVEIPLASSDALIAATAITSDANALISLDGDLRLMGEIDILYTKIKNDDYESEKMIELLEVKDFLVETLGDKEFLAKFNLAS